MKEQRHNYLIKDKLPSDWDILPIEKIVAKDKGSIKIGPFGSSLKKEYLVKEGYKVYGQENIIEEDFTLGERFIDRERFELLRTNEILPGDIVMSMMGTIGKVLIVPDSIQKGIMDSHLLRIRLDENLMNKDFFIQLFKDYYPTYKQIQRMSVGGIMSGLSSSIIRKIKLPVPPLKEQLKISSILSVWDKAIELKEKLIEQKKELKKGLMQKLLTGEVRLPGFEGEWKEVKLKDLGVLKAGSAFPEKYQNQLNGKYPFFKVSDMNNEENEKYMLTANNYISEDIRTELKASVIPKNSIVFAKVGAALFLERKRLLKFDSCIDNNMMALVVKENIDFSFVYYLLLNMKLSRYSNVGALPSLNSKDVYSIKCKVPETFEEQKAISRFLSLFDKEISLLQNELLSIEQQKKGLMQLLLTGKVRVKV